MMSPICRSLALLISIVCVAITMNACESTPGDRILAIDSQGSVVALLFHDNDRNSVFSAADQRLPGVTVDLLMRGATELTAGGVTDSAGFRGFSVPVGRYTVQVAASSLGDSMEVAGGNAEFTVGDGDTLTVLVPLHYKTVTIAEARVLTDRARRWVKGIALNAPIAFADSTMHITSDSVAIRIVNVRPNLGIFPAESVLFLSRKSTRNGQPVIEAGTPPYDMLILASGVPVPPPDSLSTLAASTADSARRDARLAKVAAATISDTVTISGNNVLTVSDGSGPLRVFLSPNINFGQRNRFRPGVKLDVVGVLVPDATNAGQWVLKPRISPDVVILP
jgi:hypothetical protein